MSTETLPHIKVVQESESYLREFHITKALAGSNEMEYPFGEMSEGFTQHLNDKSDDGINNLGLSLINQMMVIDGVVGGNLRKYSILIKIGQAFDPKDVYPIVLWRMLRVLFPEAIGRVVLISTAVVKNLAQKPGVSEEHLDYSMNNYQEIVMVEKEEVEFAKTSEQIYIEHLFKKKPKANLKPKQSKKSKGSKTKKLS